MKPLKIALFSGNYNYVMDGPVRALNRLVSYLQGQGHEVLVFAPTSDTPACEPAGTLISAPSVPIPGRSEYRLALGMPRFIRARLEAFEPDLFHLAAPDWLGHSALKQAQRLDVPAVASFHTRFDTYARYYGGAWLEAALTAVLTRFYNQCSQVYVPSESMIEALRDQGVTTDLRLWTRGVDRARFSPARRDMDWRRANGVADDETLVVFCGRLVLEKGLDKLEAAYDLAQQEGGGLRFLILGDGPERARLEERMPRAVFTGYLDHEQLGMAYASGDVFFNPSVTETFGNVTLEAMAAGLPAVCADATGSRSLVDEGRNGLICHSGREADFYHLLRGLAEEPERRRAMGAAARAESRRYEWSAILSGLVDSYYEAAFGDAAAPLDDALPAGGYAASLARMGARGYAETARSG